MFRTLLVILSLLPLPVQAGMTQLSEELEQIRQRFGIGAMAYVLVEGEKTVLQAGHGHYSLAGERKITPQSLFRVGSLTKLVTGLSLQMLAAQGRIDLDAPIKRYLPGIPLDNPWSTPVTLNMVLEHSAGLQDLTSEEFNYPVPLSLTDAFKVSPDARKVLWQPGLHHSYSNVGAGYAGAVLEKVTGTGWDQWVQQNILLPLNMETSGTLYSDSVQQRLVTGYDTDRKTPIPYWHTLFRPFGALNTTAEEFSQLLKLMINRGTVDGKRLLTANQIEAMEAPRSTIAATYGHRYGYGAGVYRYYRDGQLLLGHGGDGDGYLAHFAYNPDSQRGFFVVTNAFHHPSLRALRKPLESWVVAPLNKRPAAEAKLTEAELEALTGRYQAVTNRFQGRSHQPEEIDVQREGQRLYYETNSRRKELIAVSSTRFREKNEGDASHIFLHQQNDMYWQSDVGNYRRIRANQVGTGSDTRLK